MIISIQDAVGSSQKVIVKTHEAVLDMSNVIISTGVSQQLLASNNNRSGFLIQNNGTNTLFINTLNVPASAMPGSFKIAPGAYFPPPDYPVTYHQVNVMGTASDTFTVVEW